ncbi:c-type cytochrome [Roseitranquillus sediminis]|uniref:c-type cytochrome n=1 Tax=Roseitranquillus sediminis TaxID=2809051 RepID=UPI001D0C1670|nr:cytochrome c [Roseitranquillus sediminis]MBM9595998.1 c-type cytochrome [Roseitranquillus sediminis]
MRRSRRILGIGLAAILLAGAAVFSLGEFYNLTAIRQHPLWVFRGIALGRDALIGMEAEYVAVPDGFELRADPASAALYQKHCAQCHGAPGVAAEEFALGMMPVPSNLAAAAKRRPAQEVYWFIRYGLKMSGMPAWDMRMSEADMWRLTGFVGAMPGLSPAAYAELLEQAGELPDAIRPVAVEAGPLKTAIGSVERGRAAMQVHACRSCHLIPGIVGAPDVFVGPPLDEAGGRAYIAGVLRNTPDNMVRWIMDPQAVDPLSAMPSLGVSEALARDMAAYLYSLSSLDRSKAEPEGDEDR